MPVNFLVKSGKGFFVEKEDSTLVLRDEMKEIIKNPILAEQMKDVIEYRVTDYYRKRYKDQIESFHNDGEMHRKRNTEVFNERRK